MKRDAAALGRGLGDGDLGWDTPRIIGLTVLALLYGEGDFEKTVCIAINCGEYTDCTTATANLPDDCARSDVPIVLLNGA